MRFWSIEGVLSLVDQLELAPTSSPLQDYGFVDEPLCNPIVMTNPCRLGKQPSPFGTCVPFYIV